MSVMPFGKHKGLPVGSLPTPYIEWLLETCKTIHEPLRSELEHTLGPNPRRPDLVCDRPPVVERIERAYAEHQDPLRPYFRSIVLEGYKVGLAKLSDDPAKLKALQSARAKLEDLLNL